MVIFLLWLGIVCCGAANGLIFDHVQAPQSYYYMVIPSIVSVILLIVHRIYTRHWYSPTDEGDPHHTIMFGGSVAISFIVGLLSLFAVSWGFFIACVTMFVSFCIARMRESAYV